MNLKQGISIIRQMGVKYTVFRAWYEIARITGYFSLLYPTKISKKKYVNLYTWRKEKKPFFSSSPNVHTYDEKIKRKIKAEFEALRTGKLQFFGGEWKALASDNPWHTNVDSGYVYDAQLHWSKVKDFDAAQGDIKYVWERARFSFLYTVIRYDQAFGTDNSAFVFDEIGSWIKSTTYNCGPHYKCSQEIALRVCNWIFALYYYSNAKSLDDTILNEILNSIYHQMLHVYKNRHFSKIAVRNNHAISEALGLFTVGLLFPWFPNAQLWCRKGKKYLEEEGLFQIDNDGAFIQQSFNYQRVAIQLYTWALAVSQSCKEPLSAALKTRLNKMAGFMDKFVIDGSGLVPNWGANDSALFFPLNCCDHKDFRPQLNAFNILLGRAVVWDKQEIMEDCYWYGCSVNNFISAENGADKELQIKKDEKKAPSFEKFDISGYYCITTPSTKTFVRCSKNRFRPYHADNLHLDIWYDGVNIIRDAGTYKYNADKEIVDYFCGSSAHNTLLLDGKDQMRKGRGFIWYDWSKAIEVSMFENDDTIVFNGVVNAFRHLSPNIFVIRKVTVLKNVPVWVINDKVEGALGRQLTAVWNYHPEFDKKGMKLSARSNNTPLLPEEKTVWYSDTYGVKVAAQQIQYSTENDSLTTIIYHKECNETVLRLTK